MLKLSRIAYLILLLLLASCGIFEPRDGTVKIVGTIIGMIPSHFDGFRVVASLYDPLSEDLPDRPQYMVITEAVVLIDSGFISQHQASGNSTTIRTTFTLHPEEYAIGFQGIFIGDSWEYDGLGRESSKWVTVSPGKEITIRLFHEFH